MRKPSAGNLDTFERVVAAIASASRQLVASLETTSPPRGAKFCR
jgi:hypothetical protein